MQMHLASIMVDMDRLLAMISVAVKTAPNNPSAEGGLQRVIKASDQRGDVQLSEQLKIVDKAVATMARTNISPMEVQDEVTSLLTSTLQQDAEALLMAANHNHTILLQLDMNVPGFKERVEALHETVKTFVEVTRTGQKEISSEIEDIKGILLQHVEDSHERAMVNANWIAQVCSHVQKPARPRCSFKVLRL